MSTDDSNNFLYLGRRLNGAIGYVGIGGVTRPYGVHNPNADDVLRTGEVWITETPFSTRRDAEMAEALLIRALSWAAETKPELANIALVSGSKHLAPALPYRPGVLRYSDVSKALFVKIRPGRLKGRSAPTGEGSNFDLTVRCNRWWGLGAAVERKAEVHLLIAVTAGVRPARVIGVWRTRPVDEWWYEVQGNPGPRHSSEKQWNDALVPTDESRDEGWVVAVESDNPDENSWQGLEFDWEGYHPQLIGWSRDLRPRRADSDLP